MTNPINEKKITTKSESKLKLKKIEFFPFSFSISMVKTVLSAFV